ncbi:unnamed protein product, partial [Durusdinium trenchii]
ASSALLSEFLKRRGELLSVDGEGPIDCVEYPFLCDQSLNCKEAPLTAAENETMNVHIAQNGKANLRSWCRADPMYAKPLQSCILDGNLDGYAAEMFRAQQEINLTGGDAIYCFAAKHCENDERSKVTTLEEARTFCDKLYGKRWKNVGWNDFMAVFAEGQEMATGHIPKDSLTVSNSRSWVASNAKHKAHVNSSKQTEDIMTWWPGTSYRRCAVQQTYQP